MKKILLVAALTMGSFIANAADKPYLFDFIQAKESGAAYNRLIDDYRLPSWVRNGGTSFPADEVVIKGVKYLALSGCKPHNCPVQSIAILYSPENGDIHGLFSEYDMKSDRQTLSWMNLSPTDSGEMRNILFNRLNGGVSH